jgi:hypothetical protein
MAEEVVYKGSGLVWLAHGLALDGIKASGKIPG